MLNKIISLLKNNKEISGFKLYEKHIESVELFFIKKSLDMDRAKDVNHLILTIYVDFKEGDTSYRGSSSSEIHPTMTEEEILKTIKRLSFSASFVKNPIYPLVAKSSVNPKIVISNLSEKPLNQWIPEITTAIYKEDVFDKGGINSAELFLNKIATRIVNSNGLDISYSNYNGTLEFITTWREESEEIELYKNIDFSSFAPNLISGEISSMINQCKDKAIAKPTPSLDKTPVLLTGTPVKEFFSYYYNQAVASSVYNKISTLEVGHNAQGENVVGDKLSIALDPNLENSTFSIPFDEDGFPLSKIQLYKDGILKRNFGSVRFSHYLNIEPTGDIYNTIISGGSKLKSELKQKPYLELVAFSDFQMDSFTGDFAGEIRLGYYYDGHSTIPVTGGSLSGNIKKIHNNMYLSKELQQDNNFVGPETILLNNVSISGCIQ